MLTEGPVLQRMAPQLFGQYFIVCESRTVLCYNELNCGACELNSSGTVLRQENCMLLEGSATVQICTLQTEPQFKLPEQPFCSV